MYQGRITFNAIEVRSTRLVYLHTTAGMNAFQGHGYIGLRVNSSACDAPLEEGGTGKTSVSHVLHCEADARGTPGLKLPRLM